ncbi:MAG: hypothetical protein A4E67_02539 [Syntrophaceae bacterium PtaB.Bin038]|nr:MAG: hypothetical protein A4E67_02539 [Syntrophaceae bacterium PtaB.Bin038]
MSRRGSDMRQTKKSEKGIKAYRRGGIWYDPMCFPSFERKPER